MKITIACISYLEDQNEPSRPELCEWELSDNPTKKELVQKAIEEYLSRHEEDEEDEEDEEGETENPEVELGSEWGDIQVNGSCGEHLFVTIPAELRHILD